MKTKKTMASHFFQLIRSSQCLLKTEHMNTRNTMGRGTKLLGSLKEYRRKKGSACIKDKNAKKRVSTCSRASTQRRCSAVSSGPVAVG